MSKIPLQLLQYLLMDINILPNNSVEKTILSKTSVVEFCPEQDLIDSLQQNKQQDFFYWKSRKK